MTPDRRLDQLEPLMADSLQKTDRLIEGQGQILEIATRAEQKADTTAKGVADLTISTQKQFEELRAGQEELRSGQEELRAGQDELRSVQENLLTSQEELRVGQENIRAVQEELRVGQDLILQILREKLR